jgi:hypothetical protein
MAIARDTAVNGAAASSWSHTCTGANLCLFVGVIGAGGAGDVITGVTYNLVAMSMLKKIQTPTNRWVYIFGLLAPTTGSNTVAISSSGGAGEGLSGSYTGVKQSGLPDSSASAAVTATSVAPQNTTIANNCWLVGFCHGDVDAVPTAGAGTTSFVSNNAAQGTMLADSNGPLPAGNQALQWTGSNQDFGAVAVSFAPAPVTTSGDMFLVFA